MRTLFRCMLCIILFAAYSVATLDSLVNRCDINRDEVVNIQDLVLVSNHMGEQSEYPAGHLYGVGDRVRGMVRRVNDNPANSFIGLSYIDPSVPNEEFRFYVPPDTWAVQGFAEVLYFKRDESSSAQIIGKRTFIDITIPLKKWGRNC